MKAEISPEDKYLATEKIFSNAITIWDIKTRKELRTLPKLKSPIAKVSFSSCNKLVGASSKDGNIVIWEIESGQEVKRIERKTLEEILVTQQKHIEQAGAEQPATDPESKSEGKEKPKPESEVRPQ